MPPCSTLSSNENGAHRVVGRTRGLAFGLTLIREATRLRCCGALYPKRWSHPRRWGSQSQIDRGQPVTLSRCRSHHGITLLLEPRGQERSGRLARDVWSPAHAVVCGSVNVEDPPLAPLTAPLRAQVLDCLLHLLGCDVNMAGVARSTHRDVCKLPSPAISKKMSSVDGRSLRAMDGQGVGVVGARRPRRRLPSRRGRTHAAQQLPPAGVGASDRRGGHERVPSPRPQAHRGHAGAGERHQL